MPKDKPYGGTTGKGGPTTPPKPPTMPTGKPKGPSDKPGSATQKPPPSLDEQIDEAVKRALGGLAGALAREGGLVREAPPPIDRPTGTAGNVPGTGGIPIDQPTGVPKTPSTPQSGPPIPAGGIPPLPTGWRGAIGEIPPSPPSDLPNRGEYPGAGGTSGYPGTPREPYPGGAGGGFPAEAPAGGERTGYVEGYPTEYPYGEWPEEWGEAPEGAFRRMGQRLPTRAGPATTGAVPSQPLPNPGDDAVDLAGLLAQLTRRRPGQIFEIPGAVRQIVSLLGLGDRFMQVMAALGFLAIGDIGPDGFPQDYIVPDAINWDENVFGLMTTGLEDMGRLALRTILSTNLGLEPIVNYGVYQAPGQEWVQPAYPEEIEEY